MLTYINMCCTNLPVAARTAANIFRALSCTLRRRTMQHHFSIANKVEFTIRQGGCDVGSGKSIISSALRPKQNWIWYGCDYETVCSSLPQVCLTETYKDSQHVGLTRNKDRRCLETRQHQPDEWIYTFFPTLAHTAYKTCLSTSYVTSKAVNFSI